MASFLKVKQALSEILGLEKEVDEDSDIIVESMSDEYAELTFSNDALKAAFEKIGKYKQDNVEMLTDGYREVALKLSSGNLTDVELNDSVSGISYSVGLASVDYCIFLLDSIADNSEIRGLEGHISLKLRNRAMFRLGFVDVYHDNPLDLLPEILGISTIKVHSKSPLPAKQLRDYAISFEFLIMYKKCIPVGEYTDLQDIFSIGNFVLRSRTEEIDSPPQRVYNSDVVEYYAMALESRDPFMVYISLYHIIEYYFDAVFRKKLIKEIQDKITKPDFSYKNEEKIYELAKYIKRKMRSDDESGRGNEFESLRYVLTDYVPIDELKNRINQMDSKAVSYYQDSLVPFVSSTKTKINWSDTQGVYTNLATRIYETRNSLVHSKSEQAGSHYKPYKNKKELTAEITLIKAISEMILINSGEML